MNRQSFSAYDSAMLSDEGDLYSDEDEASSMYGGDLRNSLGEKIIPTAADRRAHHNALERKRRDHIKDSFTSLRDSVPSLQGEKVTASRAQILKKAAEYIQFMRKKNNTVQSDIDEIAKQNKLLEDQIRRMEKQKNGGSGGSTSGVGSAASSSTATGGGASPLLYTEQIEVSTSYDTSSEQDSNGSNSNGGPTGPMMIHGKAAKINSAGGSGSFGGISIINAANILDNGGSGSSFSSSPSSSSSSSVKSGTVLLNGGTRPVMIKNGGSGNGLSFSSSGTSKIIVQNPQHKNGGQPHVIHVTTSPMLTNGVNGNITAMSSTGKPIIITSAQLSAATSAAAMSGGSMVLNANGKCKN